MTEIAVRESDPVLGDLIKDPLLENLHRSALERVLAHDELSDDQLKSAPVMPFESR